MEMIKVLFVVATIAAITFPPGCGGTGEATPAELHLIGKADGICADSGKAFKKVSEEFPGKTTLNIAYSQALADISMPAAERFAALEPPPSIRVPYEEYVKAQERLYYEDLTALHASHSVHPKEYIAARERRQKDQREGYELAREIGLEECSSSPG